MPDDLQLKYKSKNAYSCFVFDMKSCDLGTINKHVIMKNYSR